MSEGLPHFAERLEDLFQCPAPGGSRHMSKAVAEALTERGISVSAPYIAQLRSGLKKNPSAQLVGGLAEYFGVPVAYFHDDAAAQDLLKRLDDISLLRDEGVRQVMARCQGLSSDSLALILRLVDVFRQAEGLAPVPDAESDGRR